MRKKIFYFVRNKRNMELLPRVPELADIHKQVKKRGLGRKLIVIVNSVRDYYESQKRILLADRFNIEPGARQLPASFVAYIWLQFEDKDFVICGYELDDMPSLIWVEQQRGEHVHAGIVMLEVQKEIGGSLKKRYGNTVWCRRTDRVYAV